MLPLTVLARKLEERLLERAVLTVEAAADPGDLGVVELDAPADRVDAVVGAVAVLEAGGDVAADGVDLDLVGVALDVEEDVAADAVGARSA